MITRIALENFKCFRKVEVNPRLITVFVGPNGSGKSSILQAMALLKQSMGQSSLSITGSILNLSEPVDIIPKFVHSSAKTQIEFSGNTLDAFIGTENLGFGTLVYYKYLLGLLGRTGVVTYSGELNFTYQQVQQEITVSDSGKIADTVQLGECKPHLEPHNRIARLVDITFWHEDRREPLLVDAFSKIIDTPNHVLGRMKIVLPTRGLFRPSYKIGPDFTDISQVEGLAAQEQQTATNLAYSRSQEDKLSGWLQKVTGVGLIAKIIPSQMVRVLSSTQSGEINIVGEGFGTNALILLFLQLANSDKNSTVMIEEPEIHLHPRAQANLASVLAEEAKANDKQLIMTTHSEHILGRLLTLVAEGMLSADDLAIYAFEKDEEGVCTAKELEVTEDGKVKGGVKDFLEQDLDELERYLRALQPSE